MAEITPKLIDYLPEIYADDPFVGQILNAFEALLLGQADDGEFPAQGVEQPIDRIDRLFDPRETPIEFLDWLSGWTALSLQADLTPQQQREFIAQVIPLYQRRGTKENLRRLLEIFTESKPEVSESGGDTQIDGATPHLFYVTINLPRLSSEVLNRKLEISRALIDLEKPVHTNYTLTLRSPTIQINVHSTIGVDTILGIPESG